MTQSASPTPPTNHPGPFWIRNTAGRVWGPFSLEAVGRMSVGEVDPERIHVSVDGRAFQRLGDFPQVLAVLERAAAQAAARRPAPKEAPLPPPPPPPPRPRMETPVAVENPGPPEEGSLETHSTINLYSRIATMQLSGKLTITVNEDRFSLIFKKGTPEAVEVPHPASALAGFLREWIPLSEEAEQNAVAAAGGPDGDLMMVIIPLGLVPPQDLFSVLGEYARHNLNRVLALEKGKFTWKEGVPPPAGSFALGERWGLLCQRVRSLPAGAVRRRLGDRHIRAAYRSSGTRATLEQLKLTAQEARVVSFFDGTRSPEQIAREFAGETELVYRTALLLGEVGYLSFGPELKRAAATVETTQSAVEKVSVGAEPAAPAAAPETPTLGKVAVKSVAVKAEVLKAAPTPPEPLAAPLITPPPMQAIPLVTPMPSARAEPVAKPIVTPPPNPPVTKAAPPPPKTAPHSPPSRPPTPPRPPPVMGRAPTAIAPAEDLGALRALLEKWKKATHFEVLGLDRKSTSDAIKAAYFALAKQHHPDTVADAASPELRQLKADLTARLNAAYQNIGDDKARAAYVKELDEGEKVDATPIFQAEEDFLRATILVKARKFPEAMELLDRAIALNPNEPEFYAWRAWTRFIQAKDKRREYDDAVAECIRVAKESPMCTAAPFFIGSMAKIVGDHAKAETAFKLVLSIDPNHIDAARELRMTRR